MSKKCVFNDDWLSPSLHPSYSSWVQKVDGHNTKALCSICRKTFNLVIWVIGPYSVTNRAKTIKKCEEYESTATNECFF